MATQTEKIAFAAEMAFNTTDDTEFYSIAKNIWQQYGIPPHLLGGEDDKTGVQRLRENNSLSVMAVETGQYQRILKLLERPEETGFNPLHISSLGIA